MWVYIIQETGSKTGYVKIGKSDDVDERHRTLQTANPRKLILIGKIKGKSSAHALAIEKDIHDQLKTHNIRGEWFKNCEALRKAISKYDVKLCKLNKKLLEIWSCVNEVPAYINAPSRTSKKSRYTEYGLR